MRGSSTIRLPIVGRSTLNLMTTNTAVQNNENGLHETMAAVATSTLAAFPNQGVVPLHSVKDDGRCSCGKPDCGSPGKHPRTQNGIKDASNEESVVARWWRQHPEANVGMATDGLLVLDIDQKADSSGKNGYDSLEELMRGKPPLPPTLISETGGQGQHYFFRAPAGASLRNRAGLLPGMDIRATGGYTVIPGSSHASGSRYRWADGFGPGEVPLADAPEWLVDAVTRKQPASAENSKAGRINAQEIPEGQRNETLFKLACMLREGLRSQETALEMIRAVNERNKAAPPLPDDELRKLVGSAYSEKRDAEKKGFEDTLQEHYDLFNAPDGSTYADVKVGEARLTYSTDENVFRNHVAYQARQLGKRLSKTALGDLQFQLQCAARFDGPTREVHRRVAYQGGRLYVDLGDASGSAVEVSAKGWRMMSDPPVRFIRTGRTASLPMPVRGGNLSELREHLNAPGDEEWIMLVSFLLSTFMPDGPYPILLLLGQQGSAKSTQARMLMELTDPTLGGLMTPPRNEQDLFAIAKHSRLLSFDNLSGLSDAMYDAFCRLSTGGAFAARSLYTNSDISVVEAKRPVILNGIDDFGTRDDFLERSLLVTLPAIPKEDRKSEDMVGAAFEEAKPRILGGILDVLSEILRRLPQTELEVKPRMADFAQWIVAGETMLPWDEGEFIRVYEASQKNLSATGLEGDPVAMAIVRLADSEDRWCGTATDLLHALRPYSSGSAVRSNKWPQSSRSLTNSLRRTAKAVLEVHGVLVEMGEHMRTNKGRMISVERVRSC